MRKRKVLHVVNNKKKNELLKSKNGINDLEINESLEKLEAEYQAKLKELKERYKSERTEIIAVLVRKKFT